MMSPIEIDDGGSVGVSGASVCVSNDRQRQPESGCEQLGRWVGQPSFSAFDAPNSGLAQSDAVSELSLCEPREDTQVGQSALIGIDVDQGIDKDAEFLGGAGEQIRRGVASAGFPAVDRGGVHTDFASQGSPGHAGVSARGLQGSRNETVQCLAWAHRFLALIAGHHTMTIDTI